MPAQPWKRIEPTKATKVGWRTIVSKTFIMPSGKHVVFDTIHPDKQQFASVIALTPEQQVILTRIFTTGPEKLMDNLPGGYVNIDESPEQAARRELLEEVGYQTENLEEIGSVHLDAYMNGQAHIFLATDCTFVGTQHTEIEEEDIETIFVSIEELFAIAKAGKTTHGSLIFLAYDRLLKLQEK